LFELLQKKRKNNNLNKGSFCRYFKIWDNKRLALYEVDTETRRLSKGENNISVVHTNIRNINNIKSINSRI